MVAGEVVLVIESVLGQAQKGLRFLVLEGVGLDGDLEREDGTAGLVLLVRLRWS